MVGLVISLIAALPITSAAGLTCDQGAGPSSCETTPGGVEKGAALPDDGPSYATQAAINCPTPTAMELLQAWAGECDGTPRDASYRASRDPESERVPGSLRPAHRERTARVRAACAGSPVEGHDGNTSPAPTQPLALVAAVASLSTFPSSRFTLAPPAELPTRGVRPLERPPRA